MSNRLVAELLALPVFPAAGKFRLLAPTERDSTGNTVPGPLARLADDLAENGVINPLWTYQGQLLDGRNRLAAAELAGIVTVPVREYEGDTPVQFVVSLNVERRHLSASELHVMAVELEPDFADEAKARQGTRTDLINASIDNVSAQSDQSGPAIVQAAKTLGAGIDLSQKAKTLKLQSPDLYEKVQRGELGTKEAYEKHRNTTVNPDGVRVPKPTGGATAGDKAKPDNPAERFEGRVDRAVSNLSEAIADHAIVLKGLHGVTTMADDLRYVRAALENLIRQAERMFA